jgi:YD repeat-containing protein
MPENRRAFFPHAEKLSVDCTEAGASAEGLYDPTKREEKFYGGPPVPTCSRRDGTANSPRILTLPGNLTTQFKYDVGGRLTHRILPDGSVVVME